MTQSRLRQNPAIASCYSLEGDGDGNETSTNEDERGTWWRGERVTPSNLHTWVSSPPPYAPSPLSVHVQTSPLGGYGTWLIPTPDERCQRSRAGLQRRRVFLADLLWRRTYGRSSTESHIQRGLVQAHSHRSAFNPSGVETSGRIVGSH